MKTERNEIREAYTRIRLIITGFDEEDVIATSGLPKDDFEDDIISGG